MRVPIINIERDKLENRKEEKIKELQQKFLSKSRELAKNNSKTTVIQPTIKVNSINKNKADKDISQNLNNINKKLEELREKERRYKVTISKLKSRLVVYDNELIIEKDKNEKLYNKSEKYITRINDLESKLRKIEESYTKKAFGILVSDIENRDKKLIFKDKKIVILNNAVRKLYDKIDSLNDKIFNLQHGNDISKKDKKYYNKMINTYYNENAKLRKQLLDSEQAYRQKVKNLINSDLVISQLKNEIDTIKKVQESTKNKKRKFGVLKTINSFIFFEDLDGNLNLANIDYVNFKGNAPCKAVIKYNKNNIAIVQKVYDTKDEFIKEFKESKSFKRKQEKSKVLYEGVNYENSYNVLIIGSERKEEYSKVLLRVGLNVSIYDSHEGNVVRLKNMLDRYDIIICCIRHSRHYASNLMKYMKEHDSSNAIKYNNIDNDNVENIIGRVRYVMENM